MLWIQTVPRYTGIASTRLVPQALRSSSGLPDEN
jgi:hypothetical protein